MNKKTDLANKLIELHEDYVSELDDFQGALGEFINIMLSPTQMYICSVIMMLSDVIKHDPRNLLELLSISTLRLIEKDEEMKDKTCSLH